MANSMEAPQKTKNSATPLLQIYPKEFKSGYNKDTCILVFISSLFTIAKLWK
jgi:hypothetical protein